MGMTPEGKVKKRVTDMLKGYAPRVYYFMPQMGGFGKSGVPDIVACVGGTFFGIEVKADMKKNPPTALQMKNLEQIRGADGAALVVDANNVEELRTMLELVLKETA